MVSLAPIKGDYFARGAERRGADDCGGTKTINVGTMSFCM